MIESMNTAAIVIGYAVMVSGGVLITSLILSCVLVVAYKMLTRIANALTNRLINLHGLSNVRRVYQKQEQDNGRSY